MANGGSAHEYVEKPGKLRRLPMEVTIPAFKLRLRRSFATRYDSRFICPKRFK
jgi:hypothetical protein